MASFHINQQVLRRNFDAQKKRIEVTNGTRVAIQHEIGHKLKPGYVHRLYEMFLVTVGQSCLEVANLFGGNGTSVQRWVSRLEQAGLTALRKGRRGRPRVLKAKDWRLLHIGPRTPVAPSNPLKVASREIIGRLT
ncbi:MAG: hypothetical protein ACYDDO_13610 [Acidiferrobacterales bacterium]